MFLALHEWWVSIDWYRLRLGLLEVLLATAFYLLVASAVTWPVVLHPGEVLVGGGELGGWLWRQWWHFQEIEVLAASELGLLDRLVAVLDPLTSPLGLPGEALPQFRSALRADGRLAVMPWAETLGAAAPSSTAWIGEFAQADCPCCGAVEAEPVWAGTLADRVPGAQHLDALRTWARCAGCGLVRVLRPPSDAALQTYEAEAEVGAHAPGPLPPDEGRLHAALLRHEQLLLRVRAALDGAAPGRPLRLLDIGSGWGDRLAAARWAGFEVVGVEPDPRRRRWMERRLGPRSQRSSIGRTPFANQPPESRIHEVATTKKNK
jgi:hypothetical protein